MTEQCAHVDPRDEHRCHREGKFDRPDGKKYCAYHYDTWKPVGP